MSRLAAHWHRPRKLLAAGGTFQVAGSAVLRNAVDDAFHESAAPPLAVFVEQRSAAGTVNGDGATVDFFGKNTFL